MRFQVMFRGLRSVKPGLGHLGLEPASQGGLRIRRVAKGVLCRVQGFRVSIVYPDL